MAVRVDRWLWSVRVFPTRTKATAACAAGHVTVGDTPAKPSRRIDAGDEVTVVKGDRTVVVVVVEPIERRVGAARAAECLDDRSPAPPPRPDPDLAVYGRRDAGAGRPTKRDRRRIDRLRGRD